MVLSSKKSFSTPFSKNRLAKIIHKTSGDHSGLIADLHAIIKNDMPFRGLRPGDGYNAGGRPTASKSIKIWIKIYQNKRPTQRCAAWVLMGLFVPTTTRSILSLRVGVLCQAKCGVVMRSVESAYAYFTFMAWSSSSIRVSQKPAI